MTHSETAIVTGAGTGIGRACARALPASGLHIVAVGRRTEPLTDTVANADATAGIRTVSADISTDEGVASVVAATEGGPVRVLVHAAGQESVRSLRDPARAELHRVFATN